MRHGILASIGVLTLICLAVGDEPKRLDAADLEAAEPDEGTNDLDSEVDELQTKREHLAQDKRRAKEAGERQEFFEVRERMLDTVRHLHDSQEKLKRRLAERRKGRPSDKLDETDRCIEHIRIAAKHLKAAGLHEMAHGLMEKAEAMEREVRQAKKRRAQDQEYFRRKLDKLESELEELNNQLQNLMSKE